MLWSMGRYRSAYRTPIINDITIRVYSWVFKTAIGLRLFIIYIYFFKGIIHVYYVIERL